MLHEGRIIESGTPSEILANPSRVFREFVEPSGAVSFGHGAGGEP